MPLMKNKYYIYIHRFTNGVFYIGKGTDNRHLKYSSRGRYWNNIFKKYGPPIACIYRNNLKEVDAFNLEITLISLFREANVNICNLTNGGEGASGYKFTKEDKIKLAKNRKMGLRPTLGIPLTTEHKEKIRQALKGIPKSKEAVTNNSRSKNGDHYKVTCIASNESWIIRENWIPWCRERGLHSTHLREVALGRDNRKSHKGYTAMIIPKEEHKIHSELQTQVPVAITKFKKESNASAE